MHQLTRSVSLDTLTWSCSPCFHYYLCYKWVRVARSVVFWVNKWNRKIYRQDWCAFTQKPRRDFSKQLNHEDTQSLVYRVQSEIRDWLCPWGLPCHAGLYVSLSWLKVYRTYPSHQILVPCHSLVPSAAPSMLNSNPWALPREAIVYSHYVTPCGFSAFSWNMLVQSFFSLQVETKWWREWRGRWGNVPALLQSQWAHIKLCPCALFSRNMHSWMWLEKRPWKK